MYLVQIVALPFLYRSVLSNPKFLSLKTREIKGEREREREREREMSGVAAAYLARRASQKERVRILYRRTLKETLNWAVHRHLFYEDADRLRARFDANKDVEDLETIDRMIADGEAAHNKWRHPDPYVVPWAPGGSKFQRNPTPPSGIEIIYDYGKETA